MVILVELIHLPLDLNFWKSLDKKLSRKILDVPYQKIIVFRGDQIIQRKWKGFDVIKKIYFNELSALLDILLKNKKKN